ncbi:hypothetical protein RB653_006852 [Dictyostelium firmibasis]|uniref:PA14 domain-containing protein n=1 Tax=Dictyostelium firmibasis TaxID=79012 RepID=A0AAN7U2U9_9MYCE
MKLSFIVLILFLIILKINSQSTLTLNGLFYDNTPSRDPDFQSTVSGVVKNLVLPGLGMDGTPTYCCGNSPTINIHNTSTFYSWFHNNPGVNLPIQKDIILTQSTTNPNIYQYTNYTFFPLDGLGFDDPTLYPSETIYYDSHGNPHNFHFCLQIHNQFQYHLGDVFDFSGDDDVWVFINNQLVVDLGGIHAIASASVMLDTLGLTVGNNYDFDFFYCERHTTESEIVISTSLKFVCPYYDACNVCQGDNTSCCLPSNCDNNPILIGQCINATCVNGFCVKQPPGCPSTQSCYDGLCTPGVGCSQVPRVCADLNPCTSDSCSSELNSCVFTPIPNCVTCGEGACVTTDLCNVQTCINNTCVSVPKDCSNPNQCDTDGCVSPLGMCTHTPKNCSDDDDCTIDSCSATNGSCLHEPLDNCIECQNIQCITTDKCNPKICIGGTDCNSTVKSCNDGNYCTMDLCSSPDGTCSNIPIENCENCRSSGCITTDLCNVQHCINGSCVSVPKECDDGLFCTTDTCSLGICIFTPIPNCVNCDWNIGCITTDKCIPQVCSSDNSSCVGDPLNCSDGNYCSNDSCFDGQCNSVPIVGCINCKGIGCYNNESCETITCSTDGLSCVSTPYNCDDDNLCTEDFCTITGCEHHQIANCTNCVGGSGPCITIDFCNPKICSGSRCIDGTPLNCTDNDPCTNDSCLKGNVCLHTPIDGCQTPTPIVGTPPPGHYTESGTTGGTHLCDRKRCPKGLECQVINHRAECVPKNHRCLDCLDLQCQKQGLSCYMVNNPTFISDDYGIVDSTCCRFTPTCKQLPK